MKPIPDSQPDAPNNLEFSRRPYQAPRFDFSDLAMDNAHLGRTVQPDNQTSNVSSISAPPGAAESSAMQNNEEEDDEELPLEENIEDDEYKPGRSSKGTGQDSKDYHNLDEIPAKKKRGRKPLPDAAQRRKAQNRTAQKAFRARKLTQEKELQVKAARFDALQEYARSQIASLANENNELLRLLGRPERDIDALLSHPILINHYPASEASNETLQEQQEVVASSINEPFNRIPTTEEYHRSPRIGSGPRPFLVPPAASTSGLIDQPQVHSTPLPPPQGCFTNPQSNSFPASSAPTTSHSHWLSLPSVTAPDPFMPMMGGTPAANSMLDFGSSSTNPFDMLFNPHLPQETRDQAPPNGH